MTEELKNNPLDDFSVTLEYTVKEINAILNLLAQLPYINAIGVINSIHAQVGPQFEKAKVNLEAVMKAKEAANESAPTA